MEEKPRLSDRMFRRIGVAAIALLVVGGAFFANGLIHKPLPEPNLLPQSIQTGVEFRPGRAVKEGPRMIQKDANGVVISAVVPYISPEGKTLYTAHINYFTEGVVKGKIKSAQVFYAVAEGQKVPQLLRELKYDDATGTTLTFDRSYRSDGKLQHKGDLVGAQYESFDYRDDGVMVQSHKRFSKDESKWQLDLLEDFHTNGVLAKVMVHLADGTTETRSYTDQKVLTEFQTLDKYKTNATTEQYEADGKTVKTRVEEAYVQTTVKTYTNGVLTLEREFNYGYIQTVPMIMWVTVHDASGKPVFRQKWTIDWSLASKLTDNPVKLEPSLYKLSEVQYINEKGEYSKDIDFYPDGKTAKQIEIRPTPGSRYPNTIMTFAEDGTLAKKVGHDETGNSLPVENHTPADNVREPVDPDILVQRPFNDPPHAISRVRSSGYEF